MKKRGLVLAILCCSTFLFAEPMKADADWKYENGKYYYHNANGKLEKNKKIGQYYVGGDGARVVNKWKKGKFYGENGKVIPGFKGGWQTINGRIYYYTKSGNKYIGLHKIKKAKYYFNEDGVMQTGWQMIDGSYHYFSKGKKAYGAMLKGWQTVSNKKYYLSKNHGKLQLGWFSVDGKKYFADTRNGIYTGLRDIDAQTYLFDANGKMQTGWKSKDGNRYYCTYATGALAKGLGTISGKLYYFNEDGVMQKNTMITIGEENYVIDANGLCTKTAASVSTPEDMLFFTLYESGIEGYGQVGGDRGNACGKYQFDRRYSLIPLVKYCYSKDPVVFAEFKPYAQYSNTAKYQDKLHNNQKFYAAWTAIYQKYPIIFKNYQDAYALEHYYQPVESQLQKWGIDVSKRPYVVKGAIFSCSIQHGSYTAALAIKNAGIKNKTSDQEFIKKLYNYRIKTFPLYKSRYTHEMQNALSRL